MVSLETAAGLRSSTETKEGGFFQFFDALEPQAATLSASHSRFSISKAVHLHLGSASFIGNSPVVTGKVRY